MNLEEKRFYIYPQELFDDEDFTRLDLIIYGRIKCLKKGMLLNYEKTAEMFGVSEVSIKRAVPKLIQKGWLIRKDGVLFTLDHPFIESIKNDTEEKEKVSKMIPEKYQERDFKSIKNDTSPNSININKNKNKKERAVLEKLPHSPPELLELFNKKETMKEQLKGAEIVTDKKGIKRVKLKNGKVQDQKFKNIFLTNEQRLKLKDRFTQDFGEEWEHYIILAFEMLDTWIDDNKTKALALSCHYRTILKWPLAEAKKARIDDLRTFNAEQQKERYAR
jgi:hypothetical protein